MLDVNEGYAGGGETRMRIRVRNAGQVSAILGALDPRTPVDCLVRDIDNREIEGIGLIIETAKYDTGGGFAWLTVDVPMTVPTRPRGVAADGPLEEAWEDRAYLGDCPLAAVTALVARRECTARGCVAYGTRGSGAKARDRYHMGWDDYEREEMEYDPEDLGY